MLEGRSRKVGAAGAEGTEGERGAGEEEHSRRGGFRQEHGDEQDDARQTSARDAIFH